MGVRQLLRSLLPQVHVLLASIPAGAFVCSVVFDVASQRDGDQFVFARGGYALIAIGLATGLAAALLNASAFVGAPRPSEGFRWVLVHIATGDLALVVFAGLLLSRRSEPSTPVGRLELVVAAAAAGLHLVSLAAAGVARERLGDEPSASATGEDRATGDLDEVSESAVS